MQLKWSHTVLNAIDKDRLLEFYTEALGFSIVDQDKFLMQMKIFSTFTTFLVVEMNQLLNASKLGPIKSD